MMAASCQGPYLPGYDSMDGPRLTFGITRLDHAVGNVPNLIEAVRYITGFTGVGDHAVVKGCSMC